jgi:hypothetical protein
MISFYNLAKRVNRMPDEGLKFFLASLYTNNKRLTAMTNIPTISPPMAR